MFVVLQDGRIYVRKNGRVRLFLDQRSRTGYDGAERGLLSIALHPRFRANGRFFVYYVDKSGRIAIDELRSRRGRVVNGSRRTVLRITHDQAANHNGGQLQFGPDGDLWIGTGDGGGGGDQFGHAQDHGSLLGKILRIDVNHGRPYRIPATNPFARGGGRKEIWAIGMRNPWRFSFDRHTGLLWIGDVGQDKWEEIDRVSPGRHSSVLNFGWSTWEGRHRYPGNPLRGGLLTFPIAEYSHSLGNVIIGGYVYRGSIASLRGTYLYADNGAGWIRGRSASGASRPVWNNVGNVTSFGQDGRGELYVTIGDGRVLKLVR
jgi:glucose/arabinose dehydrogenase